MKAILKNSKTTCAEVEVQVSDNVVLTLFDFSPENAVGKAPVIVFVAGWVSLVKGWRDVLSVLVPNYRVIYIETREKKSAVFPEGKYPEFTIKRMAMDINEVLREKVGGTVPFYLVGSSLGSTVILEYLSIAEFRSPEKSILISPIGEVHFPFWAKMIISNFPPSAYAVIKHFIIWYLNTFHVDQKKEPEQAEKYRGTVSSAEPRRLQANAKALYEYSIWNKLPQIDSEVIIVGARTDKIHGLDTLEKMVAQIPKSKLEIMESNKATHSEKAGHLIVEQIK